MDVLQALTYMERHLQAIISMVRIFREFVFDLKYRSIKNFIHVWLRFRISILFKRSHTFFGDNNVTIDDIRFLFFVTFASWKYTIIFVYFDTSDTTYFSNFDQGFRIDIGRGCWRRNGLVTNMWKNQNFRRFFRPLGGVESIFDSSRLLSGSSLVGIIGL